MSTLRRDNWKGVSAMYRDYFFELHSDLAIGRHGYSMKTRSKPKPLGMFVLDTKPEPCLPLEFDHFNQKPEVQLRRRDACVLRSGLFLVDPSTFTCFHCRRRNMWSSLGRATPGAGPPPCAEALGNASSKNKPTLTCGWFTFDRSLVFPFDVRWLLFDFSLAYASTFGLYFKRFP